MSVSEALKTLFLKYHFSPLPLLHSHLFLGDQRLLSSNGLFLADLILQPLELCSNHSSLDHFCTSQGFQSSDQSLGMPLVLFFWLTHYSPWKFIHPELILEIIWKQCSSVFLGSLLKSINIVIIYLQQNPREPRAYKQNSLSKLIYL